MPTDLTPLGETLSAARERLISARGPDGHWTGELSGSALSTATAVGALALIGGERNAGAIRDGLRWLVEHQNADGGWGDTTISDSNIATTLLAWSAFAIVERRNPTLPRGAVVIAPFGRRGFDGSIEVADAVAAAEGWLTRAAGGLDPDRLVAAVHRRYGTDRTFAVPILSMAALAGRLGPPKQAWRRVMPLPFELAVLPHGLWSLLGLPVVSYALPALIALGQLRYRALPPRNPCLRLIRHLARGPSLRVLERIQPNDGGFLEAAPLTAFVTMALAGMALADHPVARKGEAFLLANARADGSWPIDTNLATWVTTLSVDALSLNRRPPERGGGADSGFRIPDSGGEGRAARNSSVCGRVDASSDLDCASRRRILDWLLAQQHRIEHPYTHAAPGGWAWTDLPGGVPDADDTSGALLALAALGDAEPRVAEAAAAGVGWLLGLQNRDGGMPTFCRGWQKLPFDRSASDLTAHAIAALAAWRPSLPDELRRRADAATSRAVAFLRRAQRGDGAWTPLWFGNQHAPEAANLTYGTARVISMLFHASSVPSMVSAISAIGSADISDMLTRAADWLVRTRNADGGWGGAPPAPSSIEETALAVAALASMPPGRGADDAIAAGAGWLIEHTDRGRSFPAVPIGFYFAQLWYFEKLDPLIFTVAALTRAAGRLTS